MTTSVPLTIDLEVDISIAVAPGVELLLQTDLSPTVISEAILLGPRGPQGIAGSSGALEFLFTTPHSGQWPITHNLGRRPQVTIYIDDMVVKASVTSTTTTTNIQFSPTPPDGSVVRAVLS